MSWFKAFARAALLGVVAYHLWMVGGDRARVGAVLLLLLSLRSAYQGLACIDQALELASLRRRASVALDPIDPERIARLTRAAKLNFPEIAAEMIKQDQDRDRRDAQRRLTLMKAGIHLPGDRSHAS